MVEDYEEQAEQFLKDTGTQFEVKFLYHGPYFEGEKEHRDVYDVTFKRNGKTWTFKFGQSIANSRGGADKPFPGDTVYSFEQRRSRHKPKAPSAYDVLACIQKSDVGTFEDFCGEFGYDEDSRKAEKLYFAVQKEWIKCNKMFYDVIEKLQEIS